MLRQQVGGDNTLSLINLQAPTGPMEIRAAVYVFLFRDFETNKCDREYIGRQASNANNNSSYAHFVFRLPAFFPKKCD